MPEACEWTRASTRLTRVALRLGLPVTVYTSGQGYAGGWAETRSFTLGSRMVKIGLVQSLVHSGLGEAMVSQRHTSTSITNTPRP